MRWFGLVAAFVVCLGATGAWGGDASSLPGTENVEYEIAPWAHECGKMQTLGCSGGGGWHRVWSDGGNHPHEFGQVHPTHDVCDFCEDPPCHVDCIESQEEEDAETIAAYKAATSAAASGDIEALLDQAGALKDYLFFNQDRGVVQLMDCQRAYILATFPAPADLVSGTRDIRVVGSS